MKVSAATSSSLMTETAVSADLARSSCGEFLESWKATNDADESAFRENVSLLLFLLEAETERFLLKFVYFTTPWHPSICCSCCCLCYITSRLRVKTEVMASGLFRACTGEGTDLDGVCLEIRYTAKKAIVTESKVVSSALREKRSEGNGWHV